MSAPRYLIDTNVFIGLEDWAEVSPTFAEFMHLTSKHGVGVFVHAAAIDDIKRDRDLIRRGISLSKARKFQSIARMSGVGRPELEARFGRLSRPNDLVDATLLHCLELGIADFLVTEDRGIHERARRTAPALSGRILYAADAVFLLRTTYEPIAVPLRYVEEIDANAIPLTDPIFISLREGYPGFDNWWLEKCVRTMRKCWAVYDEGDLAGLVVRKEETAVETDAHLPGNKILKICTFKVKPERRGVKLGELLLKQILWYAQRNRYDVVYLTTYPDQETLIDLLSFYGFVNTYEKSDGELVFERKMVRGRLSDQPQNSSFEFARSVYPRFYVGAEVTPYVVPIRESYHQILFPELISDRQLQLFALQHNSRPLTPGNTIRKVYLCRAKARITKPGSIMVFYKGISAERPSQSITTLGILESVSLAKSGDELRQLAGGRSVYSDVQLKSFEADAARPVKVLNFLLVGHLDPPVSLRCLVDRQIFSKHPPQSICSLSMDKFFDILRLGNWSLEENG